MFVYGSTNTLIKINIELSDTCWFTVAYLDD